MENNVQELFQIIGQLYTELHRLQFVVSQSQTQLQGKEKIIVDYQLQVQALEKEIEKHRKVIPLDQVKDVMVNGQANISN